MTLCQVKFYHYLILQALVELAIFTRYECRNADFLIFKPKWKNHFRNLL